MDDYDQLENSTMDLGLGDGLAPPNFSQQTPNGAPGTDPPPQAKKKKKKKAKKKAKKKSKKKEGEREERGTDDLVPRRFSFLSLSFFLLFIFIWLCSLSPIPWSHQEFYLLF